MCLLSLYFGMSLTMMATQSSINKLIGNSLFLRTLSYILISNCSGALAHGHTRGMANPTKSPITKAAVILLISSLLFSSKMTYKV
jgi:hypothetical protein